MYSAQQQPKKAL